MASAPVAPEASRRILELARRDRGAAEKALAGLSVDEQVALVCDTPVARRGELLVLSPEPEAIIPRMPEAELCFTVKALGLADADWLLAHATPEQVQASIDLDAWDGYDLDLPMLGEWIDALARTPRASLMRSVLALDPELVTLLLGQRIEVELKPAGDDDWQPPEGAQTLEGQFYYRARADDDDLESINTTLRALFEDSYWTYFRMMQAVVWELESDTTEYALRWRTGRLQDLGFPPRDEALAIYRYLGPEKRLVLPEARQPLDVSEWDLPIWLPRVPAAIEERHRIFQAIARLEPDERQSCFYAFVAVANKVAVTDRMPLSDAESTPRAIEKAARLISDGLALLASHHGLDDLAILRCVTLEHLFTVGANLDPEAARS